MAGSPGCLVDTNILLRLSRENDSDYEAIRAALTELNHQGFRLHFSLQNIAEFWNVCTRPVDRNGFGLAIEETSELVEAIERTMTLLPDTEEVYAAWRRIVRAMKVTGVHVHDARLAAIMEVHKITSILTLNASDFSRFPRIVAIHPAHSRIA